MAYMEKREEEYTKFWEISLDDNMLTTTYGMIGQEGQSRSREMYDQDEAVECLVQSVVTKYERGYKLKRKLDDSSEDNNHKSPKKRESSEEKSGKSSPRTSGNTNRRKKRGLSGAPPPDTSKPLGYVDPESCLSGNLYTDSQGQMLDAMLVKQNRTTDNYYIIQLIENQIDQNQTEYKIYLRWGRVDTAGQCQILHPKNLQEALELFEDKFWDKTGIEWSFRHTQLPLLDMYEWIKPAVQNKKRKIISQQQNQLVQEPGQQQKISGGTSEQGNIVGENQKQNGENKVQVGQQ